MMESIQSIDPSVVSSSGLPGAVFKDPAIFDSECSSLFVDGWVSIACGQQLKEVGDVHPVNIAGHSLIAVRGADGGIAVFHNVCRHKGAPLVDSPCNKRVLVCPYHRWAYQLDGSLRGAPYYNGSSNIPISDAEKSDKGLLKIRSAVWWDIVFVNISGQAEAFDSFIAPLEAVLHEYERENIRPISSTDYDSACNWKLAVDNFLDGYHVPFVHSQACTADAAIAQEELYLSDNIIGLKLPNGASDKPAKTDKSLPFFAGLSDASRYRQQWFCIFPNTLFFVDPCWVQTIIVKPQAASQSTETLALYVADPAAMDEELASARHRLHEVLNEVNEQDVELLDKLQITRSSGAANSGTLVQAWDRVSATFNTRWLATMSCHENDHQPKNSPGIS